MKIASILRRAARLFPGQEEKAKGRGAVDEDEFRERIETMSINATPEKMAREWSRHARVKDLFKSIMRDSGLIRPESLDGLVDRVFLGSGPLNYHDIFGGFKEGNVLTTSEKKGLGLNPRKKYWDTLISYFDTASFSTEDPKDLIDKAYRTALATSFREADIDRAKSFGCTYVKLVPMSGCGCVREEKYSIDDLPDIPHHDCQMRVCLCGFSPILPGIPESLQ